MGNITINNNNNQDKNQKTTPVEESFNEPIITNISLPSSIFQIWLGMRDSNPRMHGPKPCALPLGQSPIFLLNISCCSIAFFYTHCK